MRGWLFNCSKVQKLSQLFNNAAFVPRKLPPASCQQYKMIIFVVCHLLSCCCIIVVCKLMYSLQCRACLNALCNALKLFRLQVIGNVACIRHIVLSVDIYMNILLYSCNVYTVHLRQLYVLSFFMPIVIYWIAY